MEPNKDRGFSALEIVIVVLVLCVLGAVLVPRFSAASTEARLDDMVSCLQTVRSQIELYRIQHDDLLPGQERIGGDIEPEQFITDLTTEDPVDGYGPYLDKMPENPFVTGPDADEVLIVNEADGEPFVSQSHGWWFNAYNGEFRACDSVKHLAY